ncbi:MAG: hypothetical protein RID09_22095 [Coleofasciculus sp. G1-WW12-02]|uniref:hypothetical protein n=1 Tax=Coleofasciculus sp. G1-WW12-02 TaxID=3068483 RepID=UPI003301E573
MAEGSTTEPMFEKRIPGCVQTLKRSRKKQLILSLTTLADLTWAKNDDHRIITPFLSGD